METSYLLHERGGSEVNQSAVVRRIFTEEVVKVRRYRVRIVFTTVQISSSRSLTKSSNKNTFKAVGG